MLNQSTLYDSVLVFVGEDLGSERLLLGDAEARPLRSLMLVVDKLVCCVVRGALGGLLAASVEAALALSIVGFTKVMLLASRAVAGTRRKERKLMVVCLI